MNKRSICILVAIGGSVAWACSDTPALPAAGGASGAAALGGASSGGGPALPSAGTATTPAASGSTTGGAGGAAAGSAGAVSGVAGSNAGSGGMAPYVAPVSLVSCPATPVGGTEPLIADFEDGLKIIGQDGRGGVWFGYSDGTGTQSNPIPVVPSDDGSQAMHVLGKGFTNWGSGIGSSVAFDFGKNVQCPYDASLFDGVKLRAKGAGTVHLRVTQVQMTPATAGDRKGSCDPNKDACEGHYEVAIELSSEWTDYAYRWSDLAQPFGNPKPFDPKSMLGINFEFHAQIEYELWLDDVSFLAQGEPVGEGGASGVAGAGGAQ